MFFKELIWQSWQALMQPAAVPEVIARGIELRKALVARRAQVLVQSIWGLSSAKGFPAGPGGSPAPPVDAHGFAVVGQLPPCLDAVLRGRLLSSLRTQSHLGKEEHWRTGRLSL